MRRIPSSRRCSFVDQHGRCEGTGSPELGLCEDHIAEYVEPFDLDLTTAQGCQEAVTRCANAMLELHGWRITPPVMNAVAMSATVATRANSQRKVEEAEEKDRALRQAEADAAKDDPIAILKAEGLFQ